MEESFKRLIYTGVGFVSLLAKNVEEAVKDMQKEGNLSDKEGERIINEFKERADKTKDEMESEFSQLLDKMLDKLEVARKNEISALETRIEELEKKLGVNKEVKSIDAGSEN